MFIVTFSNYLVVSYLPVLVGGVPESHIVSTCISGAGFQRVISNLPVASPSILVAVWSLEALALSSESRSLLTNES